MSLDGGFGRLPQARHKKKAQVNDCPAVNTTSESEGSLVTPTELRAVIFDLDGTLANTLPLAIAAFRRSIEPLTGQTLTDAQIIATFGPSEEGMIRVLAPDYYDAALTGYLRHYEALHDMAPEPFREIRELLRDLKAGGVHLGLVTGKGAQSTQISLRRFGLEDAFEAVETGNPSGPRKAEGIRRVLAGWGMPPAEAVYVGDAPSDVMAAREAGVAVVGAGWADTTNRALLAAAKPDAVLGTIGELKDWLMSRIQ